MAQEDVFKKLVAHCKEYGFVFQSSEIYDGLGAVYDYGQNGVELKNNIKKYWWDSMVLLHENVVGIDSAIFMHPTIWKASGHVDAFNDAAFPISPVNHSKEPAFVYFIINTLFIFTVVDKNDEFVEPHAKNCIFVERFSLYIVCIISSVDVI